MKKKILITVVVLIAILFVVYNVGFEVGNVKIGKQKDLATTQDIAYKNSSFYKNYYSSNKLLVVNMWATWCKPCLGEVPLLNAIKEQYNNDSICFLSLSIDDDSTRLANYLTKGEFKFNDITFDNLAYRNAIINLMDNQPIDKHIVSQTVPKTYLIKEQKIIKVLEGGIDKEELEGEINKLR